MKNTKKIEDKNRKLTKKQIRRKNAKLYPIYKMFSWDLLCFYSIQFLFFTITKGVSSSQVLIIRSVLYLMFKIILEIPAVMTVDMIGHRKSLIIGNFSLFISLIILMLSNNMIGFTIFDILLAYGYDIKSIAETNLLYDSVSTNRGEGLYSKVESRGASWYYILEGLLCLVAGYLFVINNYIPMCICAGFTLVATILSFGFTDIKKPEEFKGKASETLKEYSVNLKKSMKFIKNSRRMKSYILFCSVFYGMIRVVDTYISDILIAQGMSQEQYSMAFAIATLLAGVLVLYSKKIHRKFRNKTLTVLSSTYVLACLVVGVVANVFSSGISLPIIVFMFTIFISINSIWYVLEYKYLKNFTTEEIRNKITFSFDMIVCTGASALSLLGSALLKIININYAFLIVSLIFCMAIVLTLDYMRTRFGLKPKEYEKEDIEFKV